jgi:glycosyltransferase involved in cell wall biosynthesis
MRYRPRAELTRALSTYDLVQVVAGGPALANVAGKAGVPVVLQAATMASWERQSQLSVTPWPLRTWRAAMTRAVDRMERRALRSVDGVLVWNEAMRQAVEPYSGGPVTIAAPGIDTDRFSPHPDGWQREGHLLSVCRLEDARKGLERIIRAYALLRHRDASVPRLLLAGRGRLPAAERELIEALGVEAHVDVLPDVSPAELPDLYRNASVFLQGSYEEGFGLSVVEAMASGLPVVTTRTEGTAVTMLDGETGWLVPQHPSASVPQIMASKALEVLEGDGPVMSEKARMHATATFSSRVSLARFIDLYEKLLHRPGSDGV